MDARGRCGRGGGDGVRVVTENFMKIRVIGVGGGGSGCCLLFSKVAKKEFLSTYFFFFFENAMPFGKELFASAGRAESERVQGGKVVSGVFKVAVCVESVAVDRVFFVCGKGAVESKDCVQPSVEETFLSSVKGLGEFVGR